MKSASPDIRQLSRPAGDTKPLYLKGEPLSIEDVWSVAVGRKTVAITDDEEVLQKMDKAVALVEKSVANEERIYGITSGFGSMANMPVSSEDAEASQTNLLEFLACGSGRPIDKTHVRAAMVLRANMLMQGASGVRLEVVERLVTFLNHDVTPLVGELGSIGASGDLIPLATLARAITGQAASCRVWIGDRETDRDTALQELGLSTLKLRPKEGLAIVNGTTFSSAIAVNCFHASRNLLALTFAAQAIMTRALTGHEDPFAPFVHECKPHPGQVCAARIMRLLLGLTGHGTPGKNGIEKNGAHLQDRYSIRCLPQYLGPVVEGMHRVRSVLGPQPSRQSAAP